MSTKLVKAGVLIQLSSINTPDNFAALLAEPRIKKLAASIKAVTQIAPVVLEKIGEGYKVWAGHDRMAAVTLAKKTTIRADIRSGAEVDFLALQLAENEDRRHVGELVAAVLGDRDKTTDVVPRQHKENTDLAEATGKSVEAAKKMKQRALKKAAQKNSPAAAHDAEPREPAASAGKPVASGPSGHGAQREAATGIPMPPVKHPDGSGGLAPPGAILPDGFEAYGLAVENARIVDVNYLRERVRSWDKTVIQVLSDLTTFARTTPHLLPAAMVEKIRTAAQVLGNELRSAIPVMLCPYCKDRDDLRAKCYACGQTGLAGRYGGDNVPKELKQRPALVAVDGKFVPFGARAAEPPKKPAPRIKVQVADGRIFDDAETAARELTVERDEQEAY